MRTRRPTALLTAGLVALAGAAGCRAAPDVAAYVGEDTVTVDELEAAIADRLDDPELAGAVAGRNAEYTRLVLTRLVQAEVYTAAARRHGVLPAGAEVRALLRELLDGQDPAELYAQAAEQGVGEADILESVRQRLIRERLAATTGLAGALTEQGLRERYEQVRPALAQVSLGYVTVPDQAAAEAAVAALQADPAGYPALAARYPGQTTLPGIEVRPPDQVPTVLAEQVAAAAPDTAFAVTVPEVPGVVVVYVGQPVVPPFEEVRDDLAAVVEAEVEDAVLDLVADVRAELDITVNPRFGVLDDGEIVPAEGGVVDLVEGAGTGAGVAAAGD